MSTDTVRHETPEPAIARIALAHPQKRNAQDRHLLLALDDTYQRAVRDENVQVIVPAAEGPGFAAGHDLDTGWSMDASRPRTLAHRLNAPDTEVVASSGRPPSPVCRPGPALRPDPAVPVPGTRGEESP
ncbi:hypothetical protein [Pseudonocardia sp. NPDC046786]|uniref:hypothetical protein n=1 Tax=Pseudonocardia sp. NPDC046786 TaxID=3155471 RepID=UPI003410F366